MSGGSPQLVMHRARLDDLPAVCLPPDCELRTYQSGDAAAWDEIIGRAFQFEPGHELGMFQRCIRADNAFREERVLFVLRAGRPVATAVAWYRPEFGRETGYLHYVGVLPDAAGLKLGSWVSLACLHTMAAEGRQCAVLHTDDFRLPALKTYLKLGFAPWLVHENQRDRWRAVFAAMGHPELEQTHAEQLSGPIHGVMVALPNLDCVDQFTPRQKWLPNREHRGGPRGGGDVDFMADESLYRPSRLGTATVSPTRVVAGAPWDEPLIITYTAGQAGLEQGGELVLVMRGQSPLGFPLRGDDNNLTIEAPGHCALEPHGLGVRLVRGALREGDQVVLRWTPREGQCWNRVAGPRRFNVTLWPGTDYPVQRLPEPLVIDIAPDAPHRLEALAPATRTPDEPIKMRVTVRDRFDNRVELEGPVRAALGGQAHTGYMARGLADLTLDGADGAKGAARVHVAAHDLEADANPSLVCQGPQLYVGDLHCHDFLSEAEGWTDALYAWAREDRRLDFVCVVPQSHGWHDNETWTIVKYMNERHLDEGRFVTLLGFEWQHTGYGDKIVHYLGGDQPYLPMDDPRYDHPWRLYEALRGSDALIISHHPAHKPGAWVPGTNQEVLETDVERLIELWSMHGSSEGWDPNDRPLWDAHEPYYVLNALRRGLRLGFVGGSDTHSGRPGGSAKEPLGYWGGLAAVWADTLTRRGLFQALHARRTYALTGARIVLQFTVNGAPMGSELPAAQRAEIRIEVDAPGVIAKVELVKNTELLHTFTPNADSCRLEVEDTTGGPAFYHCRVTQTDGHLAVCSPVWVG